MSYSFRKNKDGSVYLLTGEKHDDKDIVIKMGSTISEIYMVEAILRESYTLVWTLEKNIVDDELLTLRGKIKGIIFDFDLNKEIIVKQFCNMIKQSLTLESCNYLKMMMQKCFNTIFEHFYKQKGEVLTSSIPIDSYVEIREKGKVLGAASRFSFTSTGMLQLYEYTGKEINSNMELIAHAVIDDNEINFKTRTETIGATIFNPREQALGYIDLPARIYGSHETEIEAPEMNLLSKVPMTYTTSEKMLEYILRNNTPEEITAYKMSLKPKIRLMDVNKFMLREFTV